jgi:hypothetical protein
MPALGVEIAVAALGAQRVRGLATRPAAPRSAAALGVEPSARRRPGASPARLRSRRAPDLRAARGQPLQARYQLATGRSNYSKRWEGIVKAAGVEGHAELPNNGAPQARHIASVAPCSTATSGSAARPSAAASSWETSSRRSGHHHRRARRPISPRHHRRHDAGPSSDAGAELVMVQTRRPSGPRPLIAPPATYPSSRSRLGLKFLASQLI